MSKRLLVGIVRKILNMIHWYLYLFISYHHIILISTIARASPEICTCQSRESADKPRHVGVLWGTLERFLWAVLQATWCWILRLSSTQTIPETTHLGNLGTEAIPHNTNMVTWGMVYFLPTLLWHFFQTLCLQKSIEPLNLSSDNVHFSWFAYQNLGSIWERDGIHDAIFRSWFMYCSLLLMEYRRVWYRFYWIYHPWRGSTSRSLAVCTAKEVVDGPGVKPRRVHDPRRHQ